MWFLFSWLIKILFDFLIFANVLDIKWYLIKLFFCVCFSSYIKKVELFLDKFIEHTCFLLCEMPFMLFVHFSIGFFLIDLYFSVYSEYQLVVHFMY